MFGRRDAEREAFEHQGVEARDAVEALEGRRAAAEARKADPQFYIEVVNEVLEFLGARVRPYHPTKDPEGRWATDLVASFRERFGRLLQPFADLQTYEQARGQLADLIHQANELRDGALPPLDPEA